MNKIIFFIVAFHSLYSMDLIIKEKPEQAQEKSLLPRMALPFILNAVNENREFGSLMGEKREREDVSSSEEPASKKLKTKKWKCDKCQIMLSLTSLYRHMRTHTKKPFVCDLPGCGKAFSQDESLKLHMKIHAGEKPYVCDFPGCNKAFSQKGVLKRHMRIHTGEKPCVCDFFGCDKTFSENGKLTRHMRIHTGEKPYVCDFPGCDKAFNQKEILTRHMRIHTGEKPYVCDFPGCNKAFRRKACLKEHIRIHMRNVQN